VIIDECDFLKMNPFLYRFLHWSSRRDQHLTAFPNLYRFGDQEIFINSSFRLIFNFRQLDRHRKYFKINYFVIFFDVKFRMEKYFIKKSFN
jgi:hypothetical protein